jgi:hypothetical protein
MKNLLKLPRRMMRFRLRTLILATTVLGIGFGHAAKLKHEFECEQSALNNLTGVTVSHPVKHKHLQTVISKLKSSSQYVVAGPPKLTAAIAFSFRAS